MHVTKRRIPHSANIWPLRKVLARALESLKKRTLFQHNFRVICFILQDSELLVNAPSSSCSPLMRTCTGTRSSGENHKWKGSAVWACRLAVANNAILRKTSTQDLWIQPSIWPNSFVFSATRCLVAVRLFFVEIIAVLLHWRAITVAARSYCEVTVQVC